MILEHCSATVVVLGLDNYGWGIAYLPSGPKVRIPGVCVGERHLVDAYKTAKGWQARSKACLSGNSQMRVSSDCEYFGQCGGCTHRHLGERERLSHLQTQLRRHLEHFGFSKMPINLVAPVPRTEYRNRAVIQPFKEASGKWALRFGRTPTFPGAELSRCIIQTNGIRRLSEAVRGALRDGFAPYDYQRVEGSLRHIILCSDAVPDEERFRIILAFHGRFDREEVQRFGERLSGIIPQFELYADALPKRNAGLNSKPILVHCTQPFEHRHGQRNFAISPLSWWTQSPYSLTSVVEAVRRLGAFGSDESILELGCGVGTLAALLNLPNAQWLGIDQRREAVSDARVNTADMGAGYRFRVGDAEQTVRKFAGRETFSTIILHAMRTPFGTAMMRLLKTLRPRQIIYLAPNASSLFKDVSKLDVFDLKSIELVDHTPDTGHYLTIALISRGGERE